MELKRYLRTIWKRWKLVSLVVLAAVATAAVVIAREPTIYESSGTYVVRPRPLEDDEAIRATETLSRGVEINSTYARVARSDVVKAAAREELRALGFSSSGLAVTSRVVPGTNILEIGARGEDADAVAAYAGLIGSQTAEYLLTIDEVYVLEPLDRPTIPNTPVASRSQFTLALGIVFGLAAGVTAAFAREYLDEPAEPAGPSGLNIIDEVTGAHRAEYFHLRLREEISRCGVPPHVEMLRRRAVESDDRQPPRFSLAVLTIEADSRGGGYRAHSATTEELRAATYGLRTLLRAQDVVAYIGDQTYALLFPDLTCEPVRELLTVWSDRMSKRTAESAPIGRIIVRVCECDASGFLGDELGMRIAYAV